MKHRVKYILPFRKYKKQGDIKMNYYPYKEEKLIASFVHVGNHLGIASLKYAIAHGFSPDMLCSKKLKAIASHLIARLHSGVAIDFAALKAEKVISASMLDEFLKHSIVSIKECFNAFNDWYGEYQKQRQLNALRRHSMRFANRKGA